MADGLRRELGLPLTRRGFSFLALRVQPRFFGLAVQFYPMLAIF